MYACECPFSLDLQKATNSMWIRGCTAFFPLRMAFHMFINMIITGLENPQAVAVAAPGNVSFLIIKRSAFSRRKKCANCKLFWIGQLLIVSWIGGPSHFECQPYWLYLITPHSMFVYGGNESLTNHGTPRGKGWLHGWRMWGFTSERTGASLC